jgi:hypothetical protein
MPIEQQAPYTDTYDPIKHEDACMDAAKQIGAQLNRLWANGGIDYIVLSLQEMLKSAGDGVDAHDALIVAEAIHSFKNVCDLIE